MEAGVWVTPTSGIVFTSRNGTNSSTSMATASGLTAPYWVRVERVGNKFSAFHSANGTSWTRLGNAKTINMSTNAQVGMGVCSGASGVLNTATMDNATTTP
jgi:regulation of enolase protein 1 (concanavalin A-like superfamily)